MGAAEVWGGLTGAFVLLVSVYLILLFRALRNERVIGIAIDTMKTCLGSEPAPQRALLTAIADLLATQEHAASQIEMTLHQAAHDGGQLPHANDLLKNLLSLPEPQQLIADFLREHGGGPGSGSTFKYLAADLVHQAATEAFADLEDEHPVDLERLLLLAREGSIATVALAGCGACTGADVPSFRAPRIRDLDPAAAAAIAGVIARAVGRQLRLATLLHGQAEAMLEDVPAFVELESGGPPPVACRVVGVGRPPSHPTKEGDRREQHLPEEPPPCPA